MMCSITIDVTPIITGRYEQVQKKYPLLSELYLLVNCNSEEWRNSKISAIIDSRKRVRRFCYVQSG